MHAEKHHQKWILILYGITEKLVSNTQPGTRNANTTNNPRGWNAQIRSFTGGTMIEIPIQIEEQLPEQLQAIRAFRREIEGKNEIDRKKSATQIE